jgi:tetratricopeptide (TPR) repeat protein
MADSYTNINEYKIGLEFYLKVEQIEINKENEELEELYEQIANCYEEMNENQKKLDYLIKLHEFKCKNIDGKQIALSLSDMGNAYLALNNHEKSLECMKKAYELMEKVEPNDRLFKAVCLKIINNLV